jgi:superfamily II DNA or RNA helicase
MDPVTLHFHGGVLQIAGVERHACNLPPEWPAQWDDRVGRWQCEAIHYPLMVQLLRGLYGEGWRDDVPAPMPVPFSDAKIPELRPEQREAVAAWELSGRRGQIIMPTGTGKTVVALAAMERAGTSALIVAPVRDLMYQWHRRILQDLAYDAGIIGDNRYALKPISVTTYDSAYIHMSNIGCMFGLVVFDEEHYLPGACRREAALLCTAPMRLGLTATPWRSDGRHEDLTDLVGPVVYELPFGRASRERLADYEVVRIPVALRDEEQADYDGCAATVQQYMYARRQEKKDYSWDDVCKDAATDPRARHAMNAFYRKKAIEDRAQEKLRVIEDLFRLHAAQKTIIFAGSNKMAMEVSRRFLLPTILSHSPKGERLAIIDGFAGAKFPAIVATQVLDEGVDVPEAKVAIVIGGQASTRQAKQRLGRILRKSGDARAILYEVVCETASDIKRSRARRRSDAYRRTGHHRV